MTSRSSKKRPVSAWFWVALLIVIAIVTSRHLSTSEAVGAGLAIGVAVGGFTGYRRGKANGTVIRAAPKPRTRKAPAMAEVTAGPKTQKPARVKHTMHDPDEVMADMVNWSSSCLELRCNECSGWTDGRRCTHCDHPGVRKGPIPDLEVNEPEDIPPF